MPIAVCLSNPAIVHEDHDTLERGNSSAPHRLISIVMQRLPSRFSLYAFHILLMVVAKKEVEWSNMGTFIDSLLLNTLLVWISSSPPSIDSFPISP